MVLTIAGIVSLAGCSSAPARFEILVGTAPPGASCVVTRAGQAVATAGPTPAIALVPFVPDEVVTVECRRPGFADATRVLPLATEPKWGYVTGHPASEYQSSVNLDLTPLSAAPVPR